MYTPSDGYHTRIKAVDSFLAAIGEICWHLSCFIPHVTQAQKKKKEKQIQEIGLAPTVCARQKASSDWNLHRTMVTVFCKWENLIKYISRVDACSGAFIHTCMAYGDHNVPIAHTSWTKQIAFLGPWVTDLITIFGLLPFGRSLVGECVRNKYLTLACQVEPFHLHIRSLLGDNVRLECYTFWPIIDEWDEFPDSLNRWTIFIHLSNP